MNKNLLYILIGGGLLLLLTKKTPKVQSPGSNARDIANRINQGRFNFTNANNLGQGGSTYVELTGEAGNRPEGV